MPRNRNDVALLPPPGLLITESAAEFDSVRRALEQEIRPRGIIEKMYVADISSILWEILRLRRCKTAIINMGYRTALEHLLYHLLQKQNDFSCNVRDQAEALALNWFTDEAVKKQVVILLAQFGLEEFAIEAEAMRRSLPELALIERTLSSLESRREKTLRSIGQYRQTLGRQLREASDRMIEAKGIIPLVGGAHERSAA
jgi:hypothetical protein